MIPQFRSDRYFQMPDYFDNFRAMAAAKTPQEKYDATLSVIRRGFVGFQKTAREVAESHKIDIGGLPAAIEEGEKSLLFAYVDLIAHKGRESFRDKAEALAQKFGWNLEEMIIDALLSSAPL